TDPAAQSYRIEYPTFAAAASTPRPGTTLVGGTEPVTASFDEPVAGDATSAVKIFVAVTSDPARPSCTQAAPCRGAQQAGTISFPTAPVTGAPGNTVVFTPAGLAPGYYEALVAVDGRDGSGADNPAAHGSAHYYFWVDPSAPGHLTS